MKAIHPESGFTLIETLVSFVILSGALIMSFAVLSDALRLSSRMADQKAAVAEIQLQIAKLRIKQQLSAAVIEGQLESGSWKLSITPIAGHPQDQANAPAAFRVTGSFVPHNAKGGGRVMVDTILLNGN